MPNLIALQLDREGKKEEKIARGAGEGRIFEGGDYFKYFRQRWGGGRDYSREAVNRSTAIIRGNTVPCLGQHDPFYYPVWDKVQNARLLVLTSFRERDFL